MGFLIDSSVLIALERERLSLESLQSALSGQTFALSAITASELLHGVHRATDPDIRAKRSRFVEHLLGGMPVIPFGLAAARVHALLWATLQNQGQMIGAHDLLIAATAKAIDFGVVTLNDREFRRIPELTVFIPEE